MSGGGGRCGNVFGYYQFYRDHHDMEMHMGEYITNTTSTATNTTGTLQIGAVPVHPRRRAPSSTELADHSGITEMGWQHLFFGIHNVQTVQLPLGVYP